MVLIDADDTCYGRDKTGRSGQLPSDHIEIRDLQFRHRVLQGLMFFPGTLRLICLRERNCLDLGVWVSGSGG